MVNQNIIKAKINHIEGNLQRLKEKHDVSILCKDLKQNWQNLTLGPWFLGGKARF